MGGLGRSATRTWEAVSDFDDQIGGARNGTLALPERTPRRDGVLSCAREFPHSHHSSFVSGVLPSASPFSTASLVPLLQMWPLDSLATIAQRAGVLGRRGFVMESAVARICREVGAHGQVLKGNKGFHGATTTHTHTPHHTHQNTRHNTNNNTTTPRTETEKTQENKTRQDRRRRQDKNTREDEEGETR